MASSEFILVLDILRHLCSKDLDIFKGPQALKSSRLWGHQHVGHWEILVHSRFGEAISGIMTHDLMLSIIVFNEKVKA